MKIIYVYDALCGWCYGFSPVISEIEKKYQAEFGFELISGGMVIGDRIGPIAEVAAYIKTAYRDVERATGVEFGQGFLKGSLEEGTAIFSSIPPAIAMAVFKTYLVDKQIAFAAAIQKAIYGEGKAPADYQTYGELAKAFGLNSEVFVAQMEEARFEELAYRDFQKSSQLSVRGFPSVFILKNGTYELVSHGFMPFKTLDQKIKRYLD